MSTPTTQTSDTPAAPAGAGAVVASTATTATSSASSASVVTSTVTTSNFPKHTISVGEYHKTRGKVTYANETLFEELGIGEDVDMDEGEEERHSSSSGRNEASVGTRRTREDDSDASSSKRSRSGSDRPLADAGALSTPRGGDDDDSTPSTTVTSRTNPVRDPWMPSPSEIQSRYGSTSPVGRYALYSCSAINDADVTKELDFDPATDQRRDYYIGLFTSSDSTGIRSIPIRVRGQSGRHSVKAGARSLITSTAIRQVTASESALRASATSASRSGPRFCGCTKVQSKRVFRAQCGCPNGKSSSRGRRVPALASLRPEDEESRSSSPSSISTSPPIPNSSKRVSF
ncbi:hypothetical protein PF001_g20034 [Phytophthora fragariae]|uniref:Uncharacterized protein n=1 Tax=Phytophthora fragariae TaxID=53985 RepID=A0A6A4CE65_9STRA|nr:hypothetical protein PF001_g20034 [Phytophthora fragariae]